VSDYRDLDDTQEIETDGKMTLCVGPEGLQVQLPYSADLITLEPADAREFAETILDMLRHYEESQ
jgi:hypothetical protein